MISRNKITTTGDHYLLTLSIQLSTDRHSIPQRTTLKPSSSIGIIPFVVHMTLIFLPWSITIRPNPSRDTATAWCDDVLSLQLVWSAHSLKLKEIMQLDQGYKGTVSSKQCQHVSILSNHVAGYCFCVYIRSLHKILSLHLARLVPIININISSTILYSCTLAYDMNDSQATQEVSLELRQSPSTEILVSFHLSRRY